MPLHAVGWTSEENELLAELVRPHTCLYSVQDPSRKNILARESTWNEIAKVLNKPAEECRKRWRGLRDGYMRSKRMGALHRTKVAVFEKLQFLDESMDDPEGIECVESKPDINHMIEDEQQVITDNQEYYEITVVGSLEQVQQSKPAQPISIQPIKILPKPTNLQGEPERKIRKPPGRKRIIPLPGNLTPVKILPKPIMMGNTPKLTRVEGPKSEQRSEVIDNLIEKYLKENMNEIDVFFRSMAATVKKLQPNLIPKVKMEVCNVVAKYEMQNFDKNCK